MGWIETMPEPYRSQAEDFAKADADYNMHDYHCIKYDNPITALSYAFVWADCLGFDYWNDILNEHSRS
jgi:hypothetical protein